MTDFDDFPSRRNHDVINRISKQSGFSRPYRALSEMFHGYDHQHTDAPYQKNRDHQGLTFFTRPRFNLSYDNLLQDRHFLPLTTENSESVYRAIRVLLDPIVAREDGVESKLVDDNQAFMTILSNTLIDISGFPDKTLDTYTAPEGLRKETFTIVDDIAEINNTFDLTANFHNISGDPITALFHMWVLYASNVYTDVMVPYPDAIIENRIDYQTRIWRIILDSTKRYVKKIGCANACIPLASPLGASFNYDREQPFNQDNEQISIPFRAVGAEYNDPILFLEFNQVVQIFNPTMRDGQREENYIKLRPNEYRIMNYFGYPHINMRTMELEWWVSPDDFDEQIGLENRTNNDQRSVQASAIT